MQTVLEILGPHFQERKFPTTIAYGSDCAGLDAPFWGLAALLSGIEAREFDLYFTTGTTETNTLYIFAADSRSTSDCCVDVATVDQ